MSPLQRQILKPFTTHPQSPPEDQEHHVRQVRDDLLPQLQPEEALGDSAHRQQADGGPAFCLSNFGTPSRYGKPSCKNFFYIEKSKLFIVSRASASTTSMRLTAMHSSSTTTTTSTATTTNRTALRTILGNGGSSTRITVSMVNTFKTTMSKRLLAGKRFYVERS